MLPEEADGIFTAFQEARYWAREGKRLGRPPHKVQVSKLRQFVKFGNAFGKDGVEMLEWLARQDFFYETKCGSYEALLKVARAAMQARRLLTEAEIKSLFGVNSRSAVSRRVDSRVGQPTHANGGIP